MRNRLIASLGLVALVFAACGGGTASPSAAPASEPAASTPATSAAPAESTAASAPASTGTSFLERALAGEFKGTTVTASGPFVDEDAVKFNATVADFVAKTGINIDYTGTKTFETSIGTRVDAGDPPDIADFPQPGLLGRFAAQGKVVDLTDKLDQAALLANYSQSWLDMATMPGQSGDIMAGVWERVNGKSFVWYPKAAFDAAGYKVPTTWDELVALQNQIVADGDTPWCIGIESGDATGWVVTDWLEEFMLRTTSLENYDKWVAHTLPFDSPEVKNALTKVGEIFLDPEARQRWRGRDGHDRVRRRAEGDVRRTRPSAGSTARATSSRRSSRLTPSPVSTTTSSISRASIRRTAARSSWPAISGRPSRTGPKSWP